MNCNQLTEIMRGCENNIGGIKRIWIADLEDVQTADETLTGSGVIDTLTMVGSPAGTFVEYEFTKNSSSFVEDAAISLENGSTYYTVTTSIMIPRREVAKRNSLALLAAGQRNLFIVILDQNGIYWVQGWKNGANLTAQGEGSGVAKADGSKYSLTLVSEEVEQMPTLDAATAVFPANYI